MADDFAGWMGLTDHTNQTNTKEWMIRQGQATSRICHPVKIINVHPGASPDQYTVDVQPLVNQVDGIGKPTPHGIVYGIPMQSQSGQNGSVIVKPKKGDMGLMAIADRDMSAVIANKGPANPGSRRTRDFSDGVYLGGFGAMNTSSKRIVMDDNGISIVGNVTIHGNVGITGNTGIKGGLGVNGAVAGAVAITGGLGGDQGGGEGYFGS
jgi:Phage protein Gp138 N-terminal domain